MRLPLAVRSALLSSLAKRGIEILWGPKRLSSNGRLVALTTILFAVTLSLLGCFEKPLSPVAPVWDVEVNVPLINRTYSVNQILEKDSALFRRDPSGVLVYSSTQSFTAIGVEENLKVAAASQTYESRIGRFSVKAPTPKLRRFTAVELNPSLGDQQGDAVTLPAYNFSLSSQGLPTISEFQQATLANGQATLTFINRMPTPVDNIVATVQSQNGPVLRFTQVSLIQPNDSVKRAFSLANVSMGNVLSLNLSGRILASTAPVVIDSSSVIFVRVDFSQDIQASQAVAKLPANTFTTSGSFSVDDSTRIDYAEIRTGNLTLTLNNALGVSGQATLTVADLRQPDGSPFSELIPFSFGQQSVRVIMPLNGYSVRSPSGNLSYSLTVQTHDTGNNFVTIDSSMMVSGSVASSVLYFQNFQGRIKPASVAVNRSISIDLGDINRAFSGSPKFSQASIILTLTTPSRFSYDLNTTVTARSNATGQTASLSIPPDQRRVSFPQTTITLTETNSNVVPFLNSFSNKLPDEFNLSGNVVLNPDYTSGSVSASDSLGVQLSLDIPLKLGILNGVTSDTSSVNISSEVRKDIGRTNYGKVYFEVQNGLPAAIQIGVELLDFQRSKLLTLPKPMQPALAVAGAQVDAQGRVVVPASSTIFLELVADDVRKFQTTQYAAFSMTIQTSGGGSVPVQFRTTDAVRLRAYSTLNYRVNFK